MTTISLRFGILCLVVASVWSGVVQSKQTVNKQRAWSFTEGPSFTKEHVFPPPEGQAAETESGPSRRDEEVVPSTKENPSLPPQAPRLSVGELKRRGTITFLMPHNAASYFLYRGEQMGFEYELAKNFAAELGIDLEVLTPPSGVQLTDWLKEGKGDVVAGLAVTDDSSLDPLLPSVSYLDTSAKILTPSENPSLSDVTWLAGKPVAVQADSLHAAQLLTVAAAISPPPVLTLIQGEEVLGEAVQLATQQQVVAILVTTPLADLAQKLYPGKLRTAGTLPGVVHLVWAVRPGQTELLNVINSYLERTNHSGMRKVLFEKYFIVAAHLRHSVQHSEFTLISKRLSRYDRLIARHAEEAGFDWRLVAALIFEESRFDHERVSEAGAYGLMQITPIAAQDTGVKDYTDPRKNIAAGVKYLQTLARQFPYGPPDDRLALVLASYFLGPGHVEDAQRLARTLGYDPHCWEDSMAQVLPLLEKPKYTHQVLYGAAAGSQAVRYVNAIRKRYTLYSQHVARELPKTDARTTTSRQAASAAG